MGWDKINEERSIEDIKLYQRKDLPSAKKTIKQKIQVETQDRMMLSSKPAA